MGKKEQLPLKQIKEQIGKPQVEPTEEAKHDSMKKGGWDFARDEQLFYHTIQMQNGKPITVGGFEPNPKANDGIYHSGIKRLLTTGSYGITHSVIEDDVPLRKERRWLMKTTPKFKNLIKSIDNLAENVKAYDANQKDKNKQGIVSFVINEDGYQITGDLSINNVEKDGNTLKGSVVVNLYEKIGHGNEFFSDKNLEEMEKGNVEEALQANKTIFEKI